MATYKEIQDHVRHTRNFVPKTCWIADIKAAHDWKRDLQAFCD